MNREVCADRELHTGYFCLHFRVRSGNGTERK